MRMIRPTTCGLAASLRRLALLSLCGVATLTATRMLAAQTVDGPIMRLPAFLEPVRMDTLVFGWETFPQSRAATYTAVRAAYDALKIKLEFDDPGAGVLGMTRFRAPKRIGGDRLSAYFDCGRGTTGTNADVMRVTIAGVTYVRDAGNGSTQVGTSMIAQAQDMSGGSTAPLRCGSLGTLEKRIAEEVRAQLAGATAAKPVERDAHRR